MGIGMREQFVGAFGGGIKRDGLFHRIVHRKRRLGVAAIDRRRAGIDKMLQAFQPARQFQHHYLAHDIAGHIGIRIDQGIAYPCLGRQMDDAVQMGMLLCQRQHAFAVGHIQLVKGKACLFRQTRQPRLFQRDVIVIVEIVDADNPVTACQQCLGNTGTNETGGAGDQNRGHGTSYRDQ